MECSDIAARFRTSRSDPSGLCRAESFGNSLADSVSFRFPSRQSLGGCPAPPVKSARSYLTLLLKVNGDRPLESPSPLTLRHVQWAAL